MNTRNVLKIGFALAVASAPFSAHAVSRQAGLEACAEAMVNNLAERQGAPMVYNLEPDSSGGKTSLRRRETFHLDATTPDGETIVARMDCQVNKWAEVTKLTVVPLDGEEARIRATTFN